MSALSTVTGCSLGTTGEAAELRHQALTLPNADMRQSLSDMHDTIYQSTAEA